MNLNRLIILSPLIIFLFASAAIAQHSVVATGGNSQGGDLSFSAGIVGYQSDQGNESSITEGLQMPYEIMIKTSVNNNEDIALKYSAYPNPAKGILNLEIKDYDAGMSYTLYNFSGRNLKHSRILSDLTEISMSKYSAGVYFLTIHDSENEIKTFKIIKNK